MGKIFFPDVHLKTFLADEKLEGVMPENSGLKASDLERDDNDFSMDL
jgi:hypothetical protein